MCRTDIVSHKIFGLKLLGNFFDVKIDFLLDMIAEEVSETLAKQNSLNVSDLLKKVLNSTTAAVAGHIFEIHEMKPLSLTGETLEELINIASHT